VDLSKRQRPENPFRDIAGIYRTVFVGFHGATWFDIKEDGRYAFFEPRSGGPSYQQYGYLRRSSGEIDLVPIPHPGVEEEFPAASRFRVIEWGTRRYLCTTEDRDLQEFCRAALTPKRRASSNDTFGGYMRMRDSDLAKPLTGLPRLPGKVWAKFVLDEMSLRNKDGSLRLALESMFHRDRR
jgi:hypothetical protein